MKKLTGKNKAIAAIMVTAALAAAMVLPQPASATLPAPAWLPGRQARVPFQTVGSTLAPPCSWTSAPGLLPCSPAPPPSISCRFLR